MRYAYGITAALLLGGTATTLALQSPASSQMEASAPAGNVTLTSAPKPGAPMSFADLAAQLQPAVVSISIKAKVQAGVAYDPATGQQQAVMQQQEGGGSGFIISADGLIVTNNHVIASEESDQLVDSITVRLSDRREFKAKLIGRDRASDLAVLKIDATALPFVEFGDSSKLRVGDWVVAIGNPFGLGTTVTAGIVSALQRNTGQGGAYDRFIQTDTAINRGNSGGPLFDLNGRVVGINNRLISPVGVNIGLNFAIPAESAKPVVDALKGGKALARGYLGIGIAPVDEDVAAALGLPKDRGEIIQRVEAGQPAAAAGIKAGDVITKVNGKDVTPEQTLSFIVANIAPGNKVPIELVRDGKTLSMNVTIGTRPPEDKLGARRFNPNENKPFSNGASPGQNGPAALVQKSLGMSVIPLDAEIASDVGIDPTTKGVVIEAISPSSDAARRGFRPGFVIIGANYKPTPTLDALAAQIDAAKKLGREAIMVEVRRPGVNSTQVVVRLDP